MPRLRQLDGYVRFIGENYNMLHCIHSLFLYLACKSITKWLQIAKHILPQRHRFDQRVQAYSIIQK